MSKLHNPNFHFQYTLLDQTSLDTKKVSQVNIPIVYELGVFGQFEAKILKKQI